MMVCGLGCGGRLTNTNPLQRFERDVRYRLAFQPDDVADEVQYMEALSRANRSEAGARGRWSTSLDGATPARRAAARRQAEAWHPGAGDGSPPTSPTPSPETTAELEHFTRFCRLKPGLESPSLWVVEGQSAERRRASPRRAPPSRPATRERPSTRGSMASVRTSTSMPALATDQSAGQFWPDATAGAATDGAYIAATPSVRVAPLEATRRYLASEKGRRPSSGARAASHWASSRPSPLDRRGANSWWVTLGQEKPGGRASTSAPAGTAPDAFSNPELPEAARRPRSRPSTVEGWGSAGLAGGAGLGGAGAYPPTRLSAAVRISGGLDGPPQRPVTSDGLGGRPGRGPSLGSSMGGGAVSDNDAADRYGLRAWTPE